MNFLKYFLLVLFVFLMTQKTFAVEYIVDTPVLNVRSCAGTDCKIIARLTEGEYVNSINDNGEWVEISIDNSSGYVIKRALRKEISSTDTTSTGNGSILLICLGICFLIFIYLLPSKVAANNKNADKIYWVNLFLGWIPFIWLALLLAALLGDSRED